MSATMQAVETSSEAQPEEDEAAADTPPDQSDVANLAPAPPANMRVRTRRRPRTRTAQTMSAAMGETPTPATPMRATSMAVPDNDIWTDY